MLRYPITAALAVLWAIASSSASAQIKAIPDDGIEGLPEEAVNFTIEHHYRRENQIGGAIPAEVGTLPNSDDPRDLSGLWLSGKTFAIQADGSYIQQETFGGGGLSPPRGSGGASQNQCAPGQPFSMATPTLVFETNGVMYWLHSKGRGRTYRRIELNASLPEQVTPSSSGYSVGHWEGDTLIIETRGIEGLRVPPDTIVREEIRKLSGPEFIEGIVMDGISEGNRLVYEQIGSMEGGLFLEDIVSAEDPQTGDVYKQRITSYYRPDLKFVEAPCEEYSDPFAGTYYGQPGFTGEAEE